jgi:hypothetical protein
MAKLTNKQQRHVNRVRKLLTKASARLAELNEYADTNDTFPKSTCKAYIEMMTLLYKFNIRVEAQSAEAI